MTQQEQIKGQAYSKAAKRRRKRARITLAGGVSVAQRAEGRDRTHTNQPEDARKTALEARCRLSGHQVTREQMQASASPLRGSAVGLCIEALRPEAPDQARLWQAWCDAQDALDAWRQRNTGQTGHPKCATIAMLSEPMETDQSLRVDLRGADEKDASAKLRAARWEVIIRTLPPQLSGALRGARDGFIDGEAIWRAGAPTDRGRMVVRALDIVSGVDKAQAQP